MVDSKERVFNAQALGHFDKARTFIVQAQKLIAKGSTKVAGKAKGDINGLSDSSVSSLGDVQKSLDDILDKIEV